MAQQGLDGQQQYADAMRAFDAYYGTRKEKFGLEWPSRRHGEHRSWNAFMKLAGKCRKGGIDVVEFVTTVLDHFPGNSNMVVPNDLLTKRAEALWAAHRSDRKADASDKWASCVRAVLMVQELTGQSDEDILASPFRTQFPAWFRVMYPESVSDRLLGEYGEEAVEEMRVNRDVVRFLRAAMPEKMESFEKKMGVIDGL